MGFPEPLHVSQGREGPGAAAVGRMLARISGVSGGVSSPGFISGISRASGNYVAAFNAANAACVASFYAEDALYISPSADRVEERSAIELYTRSAMRQGRRCGPVPKGL